MLAEKERVRMTRPRWAVAAAVLGILVLLAAGCAKRGGDGGPDSTACKTDRFGCVIYQKGAPIRIATLLAITGENKNLGLDSQHGVQLYVDYLDGTFDGKGGQILGHDLQLVNEDDACNKQVGQASATKIAADPTIVGVIGTSCSSSAQGVADTILSRKGILLVSPSNTSPALTADSSHQPFYLRTAHNDRIQGAVVADFAYKQLKARTAATIHDESPYADGLAAVFRDVFSKLGGRIVDQGDQSIRSTDEDLKPVLTAIAQGRPDLVYYPDFIPACALIAKQARTIPTLAQTKLMGSDGCQDPQYLKLGGADVLGTWLSSADVTAQTRTNAFYFRQFLPAYQKLFGTRALSVYNAQAYDATKILVDAIKAVAKDDSGTLTIPRSALRDAIFQTKGYNGLSGTIACAPSGDCATSVSIAVYKVPGIPIEGGDKNAKPVFTETKSLRQASGA
jgi:branched-chain amino acid transport system substrate-binding protein